MWHLNKKKLQKDTTEEMIVMRESKREAITNKITFAKI